jgi:tetratricopeptide (TPR) repeat protein
MSEHELWNELGNLYFLGGQYQQAVHAYRRSIQLDRDFGRPYSNLALTYVQQGQYAEAIDLFQQSIELLLDNREKAISWNRLGNVYRYLKDYRQAVAAYRNADELDPDAEQSGDMPGWAAPPSKEQGSMHSQTMDTPLAITDPFPYAPSGSAEDKDLEESRESTATWAPIDPSLFQQDIFEALEPRTLTTWGDANADADDPDANWPPEPGADAFFPEIDSDDLSKWLPAPEEQPVDELEYSLEAVDLAAEIEEPPAAPEEAMGLALFDEIHPEPPDPVQAAEKAQARLVGSLVAHTPEAVGGLHTTPEPSVPISREIDIIVAPRLTDEFVVSAEPATLRSATQEIPANPVEEAMRTQADTVDVGVQAAPPAEPQRDPEELREIEAGLAKFRRVVEVNPKNARAWDTLGNLYKSAGRYEEALVAYQEAIKHDTTKALFHHHVGLVYACQGRIDEAIEAFQTVIRMNPDHALAHAALGGYYRKKGLEDLAQKHIGIAMKSIFDSENEYNRACLAAICGNTDQALELLRVALNNKQTYVDWILRDPDLDFIRQDPRFKQLISDYAR